MVLENRCLVLLSKRKLQRNKGLQEVESEALDLLASSKARKSPLSVYVSIALSTEAASSLCQPSPTKEKVSSSYNHHWRLSPKSLFWALLRSNRQTEFIRKKKRKKTEKKTEKSGKKTEKKRKKNGKENRPFCGFFEVFSLKNALVYHHCIAIAVSLLARNEKQTCIARSPMPVPVLQHRGSAWKTRYLTSIGFLKGGSFLPYFW